VLQYDLEGRVVEVRQNDTLTVTFVYDGDGRQVKSTVNGVTNTVYIGNYYEKEGNTVRTYYYHAGKRVAMREDGTLYWLLTDHLGSTTMVLTATGAVTAERRYYAYGDERDISGTLHTQYGFTGQREEADIGLYFYNARWYDAELRRFVQADSIVPEPGNPQSLNRYSYVYNNPLRYIDPSGHWANPGAGWNWRPSRPLLPKIPRYKSNSVFDLYKDRSRWAGGAEVRSNRETIIRVEQERCIPKGRLGAIIRHEGSSWHKGLDEWRARRGDDKITIGLAEVEVETAKNLERDRLIPASQDREERIDRLLDKTWNIEYAGAYLLYLYMYVNRYVPEGTAEEVKWDLAVMAYNQGEAWAKAFAPQGSQTFEALGPAALYYYDQVIPHTGKVVAWLYYPDW